MQVLEALSWGRNPFWPMSRMHPNALFMQSTAKPLLQPVAENRCEQQGMSQNWTKMISNKCSIVILIFLLESYFHHRFPIRITISYGIGQPTHWDKAAAAGRTTAASAPLVKVSSKRRRVGKAWRTLERDVGLLIQLIRIYWYTTMIY